MREKRRSKRYPLELYAEYAFDGENTGIDCIITNISRDGMAIQIYTDDGIDLGKKIMLKIDLEEIDEEIKSHLQLIWIKKMTSKTESGYIAGLELPKTDHEKTRVLLERAYTNWFRTS